MWTFCRQYFALMEVIAVKECGDSYEPTLLNRVAVVGAWFPFFTVVIVFFLTYTDRSLFHVLTWFSFVLGELILYPIVNYLPRTLESAENICRPPFSGPRECHQATIAMAAALMFVSWLMRPLSREEKWRAAGEVCLAPRVSLACLCLTALPCVVVSQGFRGFAGWVLTIWAISFYAGFSVWSLMQLRLFRTYEVAAGAAAGALSASICCALLFRVLMPAFHAPWVQGVMGIWRIKGRDSRKHVRHVS